MKKVLVTGATGFLGRHCLPSLVARGYEVHAVSSRVTKCIDFDVRWHYVDLMNFSQVSELVAAIKPTHLLHLAWYMDHGKVFASIDNFRWVQASLFLLDAFALRGGQRVLAAGSCAEYDWKYGYCSESLTPLLPQTPYGVCKLALQNMFNAFIRETGLSGAWGRLFFLYGPHEHPDKVVASFVRALLKHEPARCFNGDLIRDYLYVQDAADAFVTLLESNVSGPVNIASGCPVTLRDMIHRIATRLDGVDLVRFDSESPPGNEARVVLADVQRLAQEVGWRPKHDLDRGLDRTISWWKDELSAGEPDKR